MQSEHVSLSSQQRLINFFFEPCHTVQNLPGTQNYIHTLQQFITNNINIPHCNKQAILVLGQAGVGKTAIIYKFQQKMKQVCPVFIVNVVNLISKYINEQELNQVLTAVCKQHAVVVFDQFQQLNGTPALNHVIKFIKESKITMFILITNRLYRMTYIQELSVILNIKIELPNLQTRGQILKALCTNNQSQYFSPDIDFNAIATLTQNKTPADLICLVRQASMNKLKQIIKNNPEKLVNNSELNQAQKQSLVVHTQDFIKLLQKNS